MAGEPGSEEIRRRETDRSCRVGPLPPYEAFGFDRFLFSVERLHWCVIRDWPGGGRQGDGEGERGCDPVAEPPFGVDRDRRLAEARSSSAGSDDEAQETDRRDGDRERRQELDRREPCEPEEDGFRDRYGGAGEPRPADDSSQPEAAAVGSKSGQNRLERRVERSIEEGSRINRDRGMFRQPCPSG
jgi:hypothetical protein